MSNFSVRATTSSWSGHLFVRKIGSYFLKFRTMGDGVDDALWELYLQDCFHGGNGTEVGL